jgi:hypothetical protein
LPVNRDHQGIAEAGEISRLKDGDKLEGGSRMAADNMLWPPSGFF